MTRKFPIVLLIAFSTFFFTFITPCFAASTPEAVLQEIVDKMKAQANPSPVVDYVDWNEAYKSIDPKHKEAMKVDSPEEMKKIYRNILENPASAMKAQFEERMKQVPEAQRPMMEQSLAAINKMIEQKEQEIKQRIVETDYEVGKSVIEGNTARVKLKQTYKGETKEEEVNFIKSGDTWLLPSMDMVKKSEKTPSRAKPMMGNQAPAQ